MNSKTSLSIGIPTFNRADYLKKCLESIISQGDFNAKNIEILISDNASADNTRDIVKVFQNKVNNIRYFRNYKNLGAERNILNLLTNFRGKYFFLLTDDDILLPNSLAGLLEMISKNSDCSVFLSSYEVLLERQNRVYIRHTFPVSKHIYKDKISDIVKLFYASSVASRICLRRDVIDINGFIKHMKSMYPCMYLVGYSALNGESFYTKEPLVRHTSENRIFWGYPNDYMLNDKIEMIKDLGIIDKRFYIEALKHLINNDIPNVIIYTITKKPQNFCRLIKELYRIPEIKLNLDIWIQILYHFIKRLTGIIAFKIYRILCNKPYQYYE